MKTANAAHLGLAVLLAAVYLDALPQASAATTNNTVSTQVRYGDAADVAAGAADCPRGQHCYRLIVHCTTIPNDTAIPPRYRAEDMIADVVIRRRDPDPRVFAAPTGAVVFNSGENSDTFYGDNRDALDTAHCDAANPRNGCARAIIQDALDAGRRTFETRWLDSTRGHAIPSTAFRRMAANPPIPGAEGAGMFRGVEGYGQKMAMCGVTEVAEWLIKNAVPRNPITGRYQRLVETGASNGGVQIAHALASFGGARFIKGAIFSSGPSWGDTYAECYDVPYENGHNPDGDPQSLTLGSHSDFGLSNVSVVMDWEPGYCAYQHEADAIAKYGQAEVDNVKKLGLISHGLDPRTFATPSVYKRFIAGSLDSTGAKEQGWHFRQHILDQAAAGGVDPNVGPDGIVDDAPDRYIHQVFTLPSGRALIGAELQSSVCDFDNGP